MGAFSSTFNRRFQARGTRFLVYPQLKGLLGSRRPELVHVDAPPGAITAGPADERMYVVDADDKDAYDDSGETPPYTGTRYPPAAPGPGGHFDHHKPGTRAFAAATVFASLRCVLDLWEHYFDRQLPWYFRERHERAEIIPRADMQNAVSRYGYFEFGYADKARSLWFCENFDAVAHEAGHALFKSVVGYPSHRRPMALRALEEACADLIAIVSSLHFESVVARLLDDTQGRLFSANLLSRVAELDRKRHVRKAFDNATMVMVRRALEQARKGPDGLDPVLHKYLLARPFTGGAFEVLVEIYEALLVRRGAIPAALARQSSSPRRRGRADLQRQFRARYRRHPGPFTAALTDARDYFGHLLARTLDKTSVRRPMYGVVVGHMLAADAELSAGRYRDVIRDAFGRRGIVMASPS